MAVSKTERATAIRTSTNDSSALLLLMQAKGAIDRKVGMFADASARDLDSFSPLPQKVLGVSPPYDSTYAV